MCESKLFLALPLAHRETFNSMYSYSLFCDLHVNGGRRTFLHLLPCLKLWYNALLVCTSVLRSILFFLSSLAGSSRNLPLSHSWRRSSMADGAIELRDFFDVHIPFVCLLLLSATPPPPCWKPFWTLAFLHFAQGVSVQGSLIAMFVFWSRIKP